jgi:hypothetical protein
MTPTNIFIIQFLPSEYPHSKLFCITPNLFKEHLDTKAKMLCCHISFFIKEVEISQPNSQGLEENQLINSLF